MNARNEGADGTIENGHVLEIELDQVRALEHSYQIVYALLMMKTSTVGIHNGDRRDALRLHDLKNWG